MTQNNYCPICNSVLKDESIVNIKNNTRKKIYNCTDCQCWSIQGDKVLISGVTYDFDDTETIEAVLQEKKFFYNKLMEKFYHTEEKLNTLDGTLKEYEKKDEGFEFWKKMKEEKLKEIKKITEEDE